MSLLFPEGGASEKKEATFFPPNNSEKVSVLFFYVKRNSRTEEINAWLLNVTYSFETSQLVYIKAAEISGEQK